MARLGDEERHARDVRVMAVVVLPLLQRTLGPGAHPSRELWVLVLFFSGLSFAGYMARRAVGARHGYPLAGLLGGLVSSTSVTLSFARASRQSEKLRVPLAYGVIAANTIMFVRVAVATAVLTLPRAALPRYLALPSSSAVSVLDGIRARTIIRSARKTSNRADWHALQMLRLFRSCCSR